MSVVLADGMIIRWVGRGYGPCGDGGFMEGF